MDPHQSQMVMFGWLPFRMGPWIPSQQSKRLNFFIINRRVTCRIAPNMYGIVASVRCQETTLHGEGANRHDSIVCIPTARSCFSFMSRIKR